MKPDIILYTTHCPKCNVLKTKLDNFKIPYTINENTQEMLALGIQNAPVLQIAGKLYDFSAALKWLRELEKEIDNIEWLKEYRKEHED